MVTKGLPLVVQHAGNPVVLLASVVPVVAHDMSPSGLPLGDPVTAPLAATSALALIAYPTWGELKNPGLWMFAILAAVAGATRGYWLRFDVDHSWSLIRLQKAHDGLIAAAGLIGLTLIEIALAATGPTDQPTMELGLTVVASFLVGRSAAVLLRSRQEPQSDLHDSPSPPAEG